MQMLKAMEVAEKLRLSRGKTYRLIKEGKIPSVEIDGSIRVPEEELEKMLQEQIENSKHIN